MRFLTTNHAKSCNHKNNNSLIFHMGIGLVCSYCNAINPHWIKPTKTSCPICGLRDHKVANSKFKGYVDGLRCISCGYIKESKQNE